MDKESTPRSELPRRDLTTGNLPRQIAKLALPSALDTALGRIAMLLAAYWMGRIGSSALGAVAMGTTLRIVLISPMMGLSGGGMAMVARFVGAREDRQADLVVMQAILLIVLFVTPLAIIGHLFGPTFLRWMGAEGEVTEQAMAYLRIIFSGLFFMECLPSLNGIIRGAGHPEYTLRINVVNAVVLSVVGPLLAFGFGPLPALGVRGVAWATVLGSASGVVAQLVTLVRGKAGVRLHLEDLRPNLDIMRRILRIAIPTSLQRFSPNLANAWLMSLVAAQGVTVLTAYSVLSRVAGFFQTPAFAVGGASGTLMGQNLGAHKPDRAARAVKLSTFGAIALSFVLFGIVCIWPRPILGLFDSNAAVIAAGAAAVPFFLLSSVGLAWSDVTGRSLAGAGDAISPMLVSVVALWGVQLPLGWALSQKLGFGPQGIWLALMLGNLVAGAAMTWRFRAGRWRTIRV